MSQIVEFVRDEGVRHKARIPATSWSAGGTLFFAAKQIIDDDLLDGDALIKHSWDDDSVTDVEIEGVDYKEYDCYFPATATKDIESDGAGEINLLGEFNWVPLSGDEGITFPAKADKLNVVVYMDVNRRKTES